MYLLEFIGIAVYIGAIVFTGPENIANRFAQLTGTNPSAIISMATNTGYTYNITAAGIAFGSLYATTNLASFIASSYFGSELKEVRKTQIYGVTIALIVLSVVMTLIFSATYYGFGKGLVHSLAFLYLQNPQHFPLQYFPGPQTLIYYVTANPWVILLVGIVFPFAAFCAATASALAGTRMMFAWSFDGIIPRSLSKLDRRFSSPYLIIIMTGIIGEISVFVWNYTSLLAYFLSYTTGFMLIYIIIGIAATVFPFMKKTKEIYEASPPIVRVEVAGFPLISILGIIAVIGSFIIAVMTVLPAYSGITNPTYMLATLGVGICNRVLLRRICCQQGQGIRSFARVQGSTPRVKSKWNLTNFKPNPFLNSQTKLAPSCLRHTGWELL